MANTDLPIVTRSRLVADLKGMGLIAGDTVMLHASVKAVGWIVGGPDMVIQALVDVVGMSLKTGRTTGSRRIWRSARRSIRSEPALCGGGVY